MECTVHGYNDRTCAPEDPCDWVENNRCEEYCLERVDEMFDDSADCQ